MNPERSRLEDWMCRLMDVPIPRWVGWPFFLGNRVALTRHTVPIDRLPAELERFRVVHLTDFHAGEYPNPRRLTRVIDRANELEPDLIALTGDYLGHTERYDPKSIAIIGRLRARHGVYAVMGNHDLWPDYTDQMVDDLTASGIRILDNRNVMLDEGSARLCLIGVNDLSFGRANLDKAADGARQADVRLLMTHTPDIAFSLNGHRPDLILAGHTHGGQINLPFLGRLVHFSDYARTHGYGMTQYRGSHVFNNRGIGTSFLPIRIRCRPEIAELTLVRAPE